MLNTKLSDFTTDQLNTYITLVEEAQKDWDRKIHLVETKLSQGSLRDELLKEYSIKSEMISLLRVQLLNARNEVIRNSIAPNLTQKINLK